MRGTSNLPGDFKARLETIVETTPDKISVPELKKLINSVENLERSGNRDTKELLNALNRAAGEIVKLRTVEMAGNEKIEASFSREVAELNGAFTDVVRALTDLPSLIPETDTKPLEEQLEQLNRRIASMDVKPEVNLPAPIVQVDAPEVKVDLKDLKGDMKAVEKAIKGISIPEAADTTNLEDLMEGLLKGIKEVRDRPLPMGYATVTAQMQGWNSDTSAWIPVAVDEDGQLLGVGGGTTPVASVYGTGVYGTATYS